MKQEQAPGLTPRTVLFIGGGIFILLFSACAASGQLYYVHDADKAMNAFFGIALVNGAVSVVTVIAAIALVVRRRRSTSRTISAAGDISYNDKWTKKEKSGNDRIE
ncbi:MAG: hypothetical protein ACYDDI_02190 [Candidatus Acidiferrales bacterium]